MLRKKTIRSKMLLLMTGLGILSALASGGVQYLQFHRHIHERLRMDLERAVTVSVPALDPEVIRTGVDPERQNDPGFVENMKLLRTVAEGLKLTYFYTVTGRGRALRILAERGRRLRMGRYRPV